MYVGIKALLHKLGLHKTTSTRTLQKTVGDFHSVVGILGEGVHKKTHLQTGSTIKVLEFRGRYEY